MTMDPSSLLIVGDHIPNGGNQSGMIDGNHMLHSTLPVSIPMDTIDDLPDVGPVLEKSGIWDDETDDPTSLRNLDMYDFSPDEDDGENLPFDENFLCQTDSELGSLEPTVVHPTISTSMPLPFPNGLVGTPGGIFTNMQHPSTMRPNFHSGGLVALQSLNGNAGIFAGTGAHNHIPRVVTFDPSLLSFINGRAVVVQHQAATAIRTIGVPPTQLNSVVVSTASVNLLRPIVSSSVTSASLSVTDSSADQFPTATITCPLQNPNSRPVLSPSRQSHRNRHVKSRPGTAVDCGTVTTAIRPPMPRDKDNNQEYERVMDILKQYRVQVAERSVDATMPCKRRKSRPLVASGTELVRSSAQSKTFQSPAAVANVSSPCSSDSRNISTHRTRICETSGDGSWKNGDASFSDSCGSSCSAMDSTPSVHSACTPPKENNQSALDRPRCPVTEWNGVAQDHTNNSIGFSGVCRNILRADKCPSVPGENGTALLSSPGEVSEHVSREPKICQMSSSCTCYIAEREDEDLSRMFCSAQLGCAQSLTALRTLLENRFGLDGDELRVETIAYKGRLCSASSRVSNDSHAKMNLRRSSSREKLLCLVYQRPGHTCAASFAVALLVLWDGIGTDDANHLYELLLPVFVESDGKPNGGDVEKKLDLTANCEISRRKSATFNLRQLPTVLGHMSQPAADGKPDPCCPRSSVEVLPCLDSKTKIESHLTNVSRTMKQLLTKAAATTLDEQLESTLVPWSSVTAFVGDDDNSDAALLDTRCTAILSLAKCDPNSSPSSETVHTLPLFTLDRSRAEADHGDRSVHVTKSRDTEMSTKSLDANDTEKWASKPSEQIFAVRDHRSSRSSSADLLDEGSRVQSPAKNASIDSAPPNDAELSELDDKTPSSCDLEKLFETPDSGEEVNREDMKRISHSGRQQNTTKKSSHLLPMDDDFNSRKIISSGKAVEDGDTSTVKESENGSIGGKSSGNVVEVGPISHSGDEDDNLEMLRDDTDLVGESVAIVLTHGAVLFQLGMRYATRLPSKGDDRHLPPENISLVFRRCVGKTQDGEIGILAKFEEDLSEKMPKTNEKFSLENVKSVASPNSDFHASFSDIMMSSQQTDDFHSGLPSPVSPMLYGLAGSTPVNRTVTLTTNSVPVVKWIKPQPVVTGPYQCWG